MTSHAAIAAAYGRGAAPGAVLRAVRHVEANIGARLTLAVLAAEACMSRFHFARVFRAHTGETPHAFVVRARIDHARRMLAEGASSLAEMAAALGFCDQGHFARVFRRVTGRTPTAWRRRNACRAGDQCAPPASPAAPPRLGCASHTSGTRSRNTSADA